MMLNDLLVFLLIGLLMLVGMLGIVLPVLPDLPLVWVGALIYGLTFGWGKWGPWLFGFITLMGVVGVTSEIWVSGTGARKAGASLWGVLGGLLGGLVGLIFFTPIGAIVGMLAGTYVVEVIRLRDPERALQATLGMGLGYGASFGVKLISGGLMIASWLVWLLVG